MPIANNHGVRLHWDEKGQGTPVLLVMGHRYSSAMWYPVIPALSAEHRLIWFDNRGTGQSDAPRGFTVGDMADDAFAVMDAAGVSRAHVFGVSMGGAIVQEMAIRHPHRVISLIVGCTGVLSAEKPRLPAVFRLLYYLPAPVLKLILRGRQDDHGYGSAAKPDAVAKDLAMVAQDPFVVSGVVAQAAAIAGYAVSREAVSELTMPALVLHGDEDRTVKFEWGQELADILPNSRFVRVEGAGHNFFVAGGEPVVEAVRSFIDSVDHSATAT